MFVYAPDCNHHLLFNSGYQPLAAGGAWKLVRPCPQPALQAQWQLSLRVWEPGSWFLAELSLATTIVDRYFRVVRVGAVLCRWGLQPNNLHNSARCIPYAKKHAAALLVELIICLICNSHGVGPYLSRKDFLPSFLGSAKKQCNAHSNLYNPNIKYQCWDSAILYKVSPWPTKEQIVRHRRGTVCNLFAMFSIFWFLCGNLGRTVACTSLD